jgi:hypothetical protein
MNADEKRKVFEELLEGYQDYIESEFSYDDGEREAERKAWLNKYDGIKEPLIKDEKIRKAVRAWAELHELENVFYFAYTIHKELSYLKSKDTGVVIDIVALPELEDGKIYTIAELCGEEDE